MTLPAPTRLGETPVQWERLGRWALAVFAFCAVASISLQNFAWVGAAAWILGMAQTRRWRIPASPMSLPLLLLAAALVASSLWAGRLNASVFGLRKVSLMLIFFLTLALARKPVRAERYLNLFIIGAALCAVWAVIAHALGWDEGRAQSFSGDYMAAGGMFMLGLILAAARFLFDNSSRRWGWAVAAGILAVALLLTYTRSAWIGAGVALLVLGGLKDWRWPLVALLAAALFLVLWPSNPISQRVFTLTSKYHSSNVERKYMWGTGLQLVRDCPITGYGVDNLSEVYSRHVHPKALEQKPPHVHNTLLQLTINGGLPAAGFYLWWVVAVVGFGWRIWRVQRANAPPLAGASLGIAAAFLGFVVNGLFEFNFGTSQVVSIVYFLTGLLPAYAGFDAKRPIWELPAQPRILCLRPRFRGDVLMLSSVARLIKRDYPKAQVDLLTEPASVGTAFGEPCWSHIISLPRKDAHAWWKTLRQIRATDYDVVCDLFGNPRTAILAFFSGARFRLGPQVKFWGGLYDGHTQPDQPGPRPAWESTYDHLRSLGFKQLSLRPRWVVAEEDDAWIRKFLRLRRLSSGAILGLFPGASHPAKRWPLPQFMEVARRAPKELGLKAVFVFGPAEHDLNREYIRAVGKTSLSVEGLTPGRLAALWQHCALVISNDAFPMHLGPAVNTPTLGLFGPGEPKIWFPYSPRSGHHVLHAPPACWPCHKDSCEDTLCWQAITPDRVLEKCRAMVREHRRPRRNEIEPRMKTRKS